MLGEDFKGFYNLQRHITSDTHKLNVELNNPDIKESHYLNLLVQKYPDIVISDKKNIKCRICLYEFCATYKNIDSNIKQHLKSEKHIRLRNKRSHSANTKDISSFFVKKKTCEPREPSEL